MQLYHVLVEDGLPLAAHQREDGGRRQRTQVPQGQGRTTTAQLQPQHTLALSTTAPPSVLINHGSTIQSESVAKQLIHFPY